MTQVQHLRIVWLAFALGMLGIPVPRAAASPTVASFTVSPGTLTFPSASPTVSTIAATENPIVVSVHLTNANNGTLTVIAGGDLTSGANTIPINKVSWTTTDPGFVNGTLSKTSQVTIASGPTGSSNITVTGHLTFSFANSWAYATGSYTQTLTFTATAL